MVLALSNGFRDKLILIIQFRADSHDLYTSHILEDFPVPEDAGVATV